MNIKIITLNDKFIDAVANDCNLLDWAEKWIKDSEVNDEIEFWNGGTIDIINGQWITFRGDNGRLELDVTTKTI